MPPVALNDDRVVEIQGEPLGVQEAVELISSHLRKFLVDRSVLPLFEAHASFFFLFILASCISVSDNVLHAVAVCDDVNFNLLR